MGSEPSLREQEQITEALKRHGEVFTAAERRAEFIVTGGFVLAGTALLIAFPPTADGWHVTAALSCVVALIVSFRAEFDIGSGFTVPSQLAFVPLLFTLPPSAAPAVVVLALALAYLPDVVRGELRA